MDRFKNLLHLLRTASLGFVLLALGVIMLAGIEEKPDWVMPTVIGVVAILLLVVFIVPFLPIRKKG